MQQPELSMPNAIERFADIQSNRTSFATSSKRISPALRHQREQVGCCVASEETELMEVQFWGQELAELEVHNLFQDFGGLRKDAELQRERKELALDRSRWFRTRPQPGVRGARTCETRRLFEDAKWLPWGWF